MSATPGRPADGAQPDLRALAEAVRAHDARARAQARLAREIQQLRASAAMLAEEKPDRSRAAEAALDLVARREALIEPETRAVLSQRLQRHGAPEDDRPALTDHGDILTGWWRENPPGEMSCTDTSVQARPEVQVGLPAHPIATPGDLRALCRDIDLTDPEIHVRFVLDGEPAALLTMILDLVVERGGDPGALHGSLHANIGSSTSGWLAAPQRMAEVAERLLRLGVHGFSPFGIGGPRPQPDLVKALADALAEAHAGIGVLSARGLPADAVAPFWRYWCARPERDPTARASRWVARRVWAIAMRDLHHAGPDAQTLRCEGEGPETRHVDALTDRVQADVLAEFMRRGRTG